MKKILQIFCFGIIFSFSFHSLAQEPEAENLEYTATQLIRLADNQMRLAKIAQMQSDESSAAQYQQQADKYLSLAQDSLKMANQLRQQMLKELRSQRKERLNKIRVVSWNIQNFGESKLGKTVIAKGESKPLPKVIAEILLATRFDVAALQEMEGDNLEPLEAVIRYLNEQSGEETYRMTYPEKLGTSENRAEYLPIIYNSKLMKSITQGMVKDVDMQRPPHYAFFSLRPSQFVTPQPGRDHWDFCLVSVHLAPKGSGAKDNPRRNDFKMLSKVSRYLEKKFPEDDILIAGDFNCDPNRRGIDGELWEETRKDFLVTPLETIVNRSRVKAERTMVRGDRVNDNIIWRPSSRDDWTGVKEVYHFEKNHFTADEARNAERVSDHLPIWAEFYVDRDIE